MDSLIPLDEVKKALEDKCPSVLLRPNFSNYCALVKYICKKRCTFSYLQSVIMGWAGISMARALYALIGTVPFTVLVNPGDTAAYPHH